MGAWREAPRRLLYPLGLVARSGLFFDYGDNRACSRLQRDILLVLLAEGRVPDTLSGIAGTVKKWFGKDFSRTSVGRVLKKLEDEGLVERSNGSLILTWRGLLAAGRYIVVARTLYTLLLGVLYAGLAVVGVIGWPLSVIGLGVAVAYVAGYFSVLFAGGLGVNRAPRPFWHVARLVPSVLGTTVLVALLAGMVSRRGLSR